MKSLSSNWYRNEYNKLLDCFHMLTYGIIDPNSEEYKTLEKELDFSLHKLKKKFFGQFPQENTDNFSFWYDGE